MSVCDILLSEKDAIKEIVEMSKEDGLEHGFVLCRLPDGSLHPSREVYSTPEEAFLPSCPLGSDEVGSVHTHPSDIPLPSELDIISSLEHDLNFSCVADDSGKAYCVVFNKDHEKYEYYKETLLRLHDANAGALIRGNFQKASEIAEDIDLMIKKAFEEGVFRYETCELW